MAALLPHHQKLIAESAISAEVAGERGYFSVSKPRELIRMFGPSQRLAPGLVIPLYNVFGERFSYQLRPDNPRTGRDGKLRKYETPAGLKMALDVPPSLDSSVRPV
jgi:hypothetical protein